MSYSVPRSFGDVGSTLAGDNVTIASAFSAIEANKIGLSPPSQLMFTVGRIAIEATLGTTLSQTGADLSKNVVDIVSGLAMDLSSEVAGAFSAVADNIPMIGACIKVISDTVDAVNAWDHGDRDAARARCKSGGVPLTSPTPSGSTLAGCVTCPSDIFTSGELGAALIAATEDVEVGGYPLYDAKGNPYGDALHPVNAPQSNFILSTYSTAAKQRGLATGPSAARRAVYRKIRLAIQSAHRTKGDGKPASDAGMSLWGAYQDMLLYDWHAGVIDDNWLLMTNSNTASTPQDPIPGFNLLWPATCSAAQLAQPGQCADHAKYTAAQQFGSYSYWKSQGFAPNANNVYTAWQCASLTKAASIEALIAQWDNAVNPVTIAGQQALQAIQSSYQSVLMQSLLSQWKSQSTEVVDYNAAAVAAVAKWDATNQNTPAAAELAREGKMADLVALWQQQTAAQNAAYRAAHPPPRAPMVKMTAAQLASFKEQLSRPVTPLVLKKQTTRSAAGPVFAGIAVLPLLLMYLKKRHR